MNFNKICVVGLGYIGLPTAAIFASHKKKVIGIDNNKSVVKTINEGKVHIVEPDLDLIVQDSVSEGYLTASTEIQSADAFLIAVPTPFKNTINSQYPEPDISYVKEAAILISSVLEKGNLVILESTSPVGTTEKLTKWMSAERPDLTFPENSNKKPDINIAYCPERVLPGKILKELITNDRIIGGMTSTCSSKASSLYKIFVKADCIKTNSKTAEMAKLTENSSRDVEIAFANELSIICDELDINVWELISLANRHPRVNILKPGPGVGGHCIAVDPWFIVSSAPENSNLIKCARKVNDFKPEYVLKKIEDEIRNFLKENPKKNIKDLKIGCFGLAFKQDIDDLRESPALAIALELAARYPSQVVVSEPNIKNLPDKVNPLLKLLLYSECYEDSDIKVLLVAHKEFLNSVKPDKYFIDCVGAWT